MEDVKYTNACLFFLFLFTSTIGDYLRTHCQFLFQKIFEEAMYYVKS